MSVKLQTHSDVDSQWDQQDQDTFPTTGGHVTHVDVQVCPPVGVSVDRHNVSSLLMIGPQSGAAELRGSHWSTGSDSAGLHISGVYMSNIYWSICSVQSSPAAGFRPVDVTVSNMDLSFGPCWTLCLSSCFVFQLLEENICTFVKNELKKFHQVLSTDYPECLESLSDEDEEQRRSSEAFLKITLNFLRRLKQEELAERLQSSKTIVSRLNR